MPASATHVPAMPSLSELIAVAQELTKHVLRHVSANMMHLQLVPVLTETVTVQQYLEAETRRQVQSIKVRWSCTAMFGHCQYTASIHVHMHIKDIIFLLPGTIH